MSLNLIMGARNGAKNIREENDFYATHPQAVCDFLDKLNQDKILLDGGDIWECACGQGHMSEVFKKYGFDVYSTDIIDRGYADDIQDFLSESNIDYEGHIFTNPPFKLAEEFAYKGNEVIRYGNYFGLFVKIQFLESKSRKKLFEQYPPKYIYIYSERQQCSMNGDFKNLKAKTQCYCWVLWQKGFNGETITRWI